MLELRVSVPIHVDPCRSMLALTETLTSSSFVYLRLPVPPFICRTFVQLMEIVMAMDKHRIPYVNNQYDAMTLFALFVTRDI